MLVALAAACGGGERASDAPVLEIRLESEGTRVTCTGGTGQSHTLFRSTGAQTTSSVVACPSEQLLAGDWTLSTWSLRGSDPAAPAVAATSMLPAPLVWPDAERWIVLLAAPLAEGRVPGLRLQALDVQGTVLTDLAVDPASLVSVPRADVEGAVAWRWQSTAPGGGTFSSDSRPASAVAQQHFSCARLSLTQKNGGCPAALAVGDAVGGADSELLGTTVSAAGVEPIGYTGNAFERLLQGRDARDARFVDLDDDGLDDIVANVYGEGCALIGLRQPTGGYAFSTPLRADGSCIGGNGETILVADFDGDGRPDILLPSYQRFDFLRNEGGGRFREVAEELGISFPAYQPRVEGAAAVDLDLDGDVDIVIANEVLINDGTGRFTRQPDPFGLPRLFDEGLAVADLDNDGHFDLVKHDPFLGPRIWWGSGSGHAFDDGGFLLGGGAVLASSYGMAVGRFTGHELPEIYFAGGHPVGRAPGICLQFRPRRFECLFDNLPALAGLWQDLLLVSDLDRDGVPELVARYGGLQLYRTASRPRHVFRIELLDAQGRRNRHGMAVRASCAPGNRLLEMKFVDGGNGYMAQGDYVVSFVSMACGAIHLDVALPGGMQRFGPFAPGDHALRLPIR